MSVTGSFHQEWKPPTAASFFCAARKRKSADIQKGEKEQQLDNAESAGPFCFFVCFFFSSGPTIKDLGRTRHVVGFSPKNLLESLRDGTALTKFGFDRQRAIGVETGQLERVSYKLTIGVVSLSRHKQTGRLTSHTCNVHRYNYYLRVSDISSTTTPFRHTPIDGEMLDLFYSVAAEEDGKKGGHYE